MMMRLDKFFSETGKLTRSQCAAAAKKGLVTVNGEVVKKTDFKIDPYKDEIALSGEVVTYSEFVYIVMNKPDGVVSATEDGRDKTLIDLLPIEIARLSPFPCGRLDKDTVGLVIITNDGVAAHNALSPKRHVEKKYYYECADPLSEREAEKIRAGVFLKDGYNTRPCKLERESDKSGYICLTEGKYHEIKRIFGSLGNKITFLKRVRFGAIELGGLPIGTWRYMTEEEIAAFTGRNK